MTPNYDNFFERLAFIQLAEQDLKSQGVLRRIKTRAVFYYQNASTRRQLAKLSLDQLRDIGITPEQAKKECAKEFWQ